VFLLEEFGPKLTCVKGANNAVADALSRLETAEEELSAEAFANELANEEEDFPTGCPLSCKEIACWTCMSCRLETCMFVDKGQCARKSELC